MGNRKVCPIFATQSPNHPITAIWIIFYRRPWILIFHFLFCFSSHFPPFFFFCLRLNRLLFGMESAFWFHIVNVLLHSLSSILFTRICSNVAGFKPNFSLIAGILFAVHPIHVECEFQHVVLHFPSLYLALFLLKAVSGIVGCAELLGCTFFSLSFLSYHGYVMKFLPCMLWIQTLIVDFSTTATTKQTPMTDRFGSAFCLVVWQCWPRKVDLRWVIYARK